MGVVYPVFMKKILICSSTLLTDRMILYTELLPILSQKAEVVIWPTAYDSEPYQSLDMPNVRVEPFPVVKDQKFRNQLFRRLVDYSYDHYKLSRSRTVIWEETRVGRIDWYHRIIRATAKVIATFNGARMVEKLAERELVKDKRSPEAIQRLKELKPDMVLIMSPFRQHEPGIAAAAKALNIPVTAFITTYDNLTTKNRIIFDYEAYFVWSEAMKADLHKMYSYSHDKPVYIVGAPQFDILAYEKNRISRENFCRQIGLDPALPIVLITLGSPNLIDEYPGAEEIIKRIKKGEAGENIQVILRPHPVFKHDKRLNNADDAYDKLYLQIATPKVEHGHTQSQQQILDWVNTFNHADVIVQLASTAAIDGAFLDSPVVNIDFDPSGKRQKLVKDANHEMEHFAALNKIGAFWMAEDYEQIMEGIRAYLKDPAHHKAERKSAVLHVCGYTDGHNGKRLAEALLQQVNA